MKVLHFKDPIEFEQLFSKKTPEVTDAIVEAIENAMKDNRKSADIFHITFDSSDHGYEITMLRAEWATALESCLSHYHAADETDKAIDCWKLLELAKVW